MLSREDVWSVRARATVEELLLAPRAELAARLRRGTPFDADELDGYAYQGVSLGLPRAVERLSWKTFAKVFLREPDGTLAGFNVRCEQTGTFGPIVPRRTRRGEPVTFGPFAVAHEGDQVVLDYGARNPAWTVLARLRDPLVSLERGSSEVLLGTTQLVAPWGRVGTPSYFTLVRREPWSDASERRR